MCGILGLINPDLSSERIKELAHRASLKISHRGPDFHGVWSQDGIGLAHLRLAIQDLSPLGQQPMLSHNKKWMIVFNGEIYNHLEIRKELSDYGFRGHSDTETLLACFEKFGFQDAIQKLRGMFAIAAYEFQTDKLFLARDRFGEKPLYYALKNKQLSFASELKGIVDLHPDLKVNYSAVSDFFKFNCIPGTDSIYAGVYKLAPGHIAVYAAKHNSLNIECYWTPATAANQLPSINSFEEAKVLVEKELRHVVKSQTISDVPVGAFLSGGIDSTLIVALLQEQLSAPLKTYTIGFEDPAYDESKHASEIAKYLGTDHQTIPLSLDLMLEQIPQIPIYYDEPFADSSQLPTLAIAKAMKKNVRVVLSGDGGDEIFGGYTRYQALAKILGTVSPRSKLLKSLIAGTIHSVNEDSWDKIASTFSFLIPKNYRYNKFGQKLYKAANLLAEDNPSDMYRSLITHWRTPPLKENVESKRFSPAQINHRGLCEQMMLADQLGYMPDDILVKVDRATMSVALESRSPFLDHRIAEIAWSLPESYKVTQNSSKIILREILKTKVPEHLWQRPKQGFAIPLAGWLRGAMRPWAEDLLSHQTLSRYCPFLDEPRIRSEWNSFLKNSLASEYLIWDVLVFVQWFKTYNPPL